MRSIINKHRSFWLQRSFLFSVLVGVFLLALSLLGTYYANSYTLAHASNFVTDILLDNLPVLNVNFIFSDAASMFIVLLFVIALFEPRRIPFMLKSIAFFMLTRSVFMMLTHIAAPPHVSYVNATDFINRLGSGNDLFFSAHTGFPFLIALIFWDEKRLRYFFLLASVVGAFAVLLGHLHYSIDVFSAFFITFGVFQISKQIFKTDYRLLTRSSNY